MVFLSKHEMISENKKRNNNKKELFSDKSSWTISIKVLHLANAI